MNAEITTMTVMALKQFGGPENFALESIPRPEAGTGEVLVRVKAIGINPIDIKTRQGGGQALALSGEEPMILGWDVSGEVVEAGFGVKDFKEGDEVFGTVNFPGAGKTYAEYYNRKIELYKSNKRIVQVKQKYIKRRCNILHRLFLQTYNRNVIRLSQILHLRHP